ncbi:26S proteasome non-ATPase regulatory subunit 8 [Tothia fuscella]|uniref:26S proteasome non-ATPase regulatory subunit 8 n=1 Tax=Tothia fuscella TaxID=1048955 RepID=A0A9P4NLR4_9PEZI|nr:26S proteasome non-ATPase regulatory subunit 8 [Tothia fuscella]
MPPPGPILFCQLLFTTTSEARAEETNRVHLLPSKTPLTRPSTMAEAELKSLLQQVHQTLSSNKYDQTPSLLSKAKLALLHLNALIPTPQTSRPHLLLARETLELGALVSIRANNSQSPDSFTRYFQQLQPFYALPQSVLPREGSQQSKLTGLFLLLLLSASDYSGFHTMLEGLEMAARQAGVGLEDDAFIQYPVRLEQALMEGSYDKVWHETKGNKVPGEEYGIFSTFLIGTIRDEIASCSEKAYASVPVSNAKNLFFLDSEGAVVQFAQVRDWIVKDGRIYFPQQDQDLLASEKDILSSSGQVIENTLGYARELETIV